jgi:dTDP-4-dehydrorhamnose reductase
VLAGEPDLELVGTAREPADAGFPVERFDVLSDDPRALVDAVEPNWIVNAIGLTKPRIAAGGEAAALEVNGRFPYALARVAEEAGARVIQIATDGVFSGARGGYREDEPHDALDFYGKSKSLGEAPAANVTHLRCSIVGPEPAGGASLVAWLLAHPRGAQVPGFTDHVWNGVTTPVFGDLCAGIVREELDLPSPLHVVPADTVTKAELLQAIATAFGRHDIEIDARPSGTPVDRSLATRHPDANARLWSAAGYTQAPAVEGMVLDLGRRAGG